MNRQDNRPALPWWRVPAAWLVMGGPATVVVAGLATAFIAVRGADPEVSTVRIPRAVTSLKAERPQPAAAPQMPQSGTGGARP